MAVNTMKRIHLTPLGLKGIKLLSVSPAVDARQLNQFLLCLSCRYHIINYYSSYHISYNSRQDVQ